METPGPCDVVAWWAVGRGRYSQDTASVVCQNTAQGRELARGSRRSLLSIFLVYRQQTVEGDKRKRRPAGQRPCTNPTGARGTARHKPGATWVSGREAFFGVVVSQPDDQAAFSLISLCVLLF